MYDLNGDGVITKTELGNVLVAVSELMGIDMKPPVSFDLKKNIFFFCQFSHFRPGQLLDWTIFQRRASRSALI